MRAAIPGKRVRELQRRPGWRPRGAVRACGMVLACQLVVGAASCARTPHVGTAPDVGRVDAQNAEAGFGHDTGLACLRALDRKAIAYGRAPVVGGMRTPIEVSGPIGGVALIPRGRRSALMDCVLARALTQADSIFRELGVTALTFSAAYDQRTRRGSSQPSAHAYGLAIDVHTIRGTFGEYDVRKHYERGVGQWRGLRGNPQELDGCVGRPATTEGQVLRRLACLLKVHPAFRVLVSPDDDADHQDHLHIEADSDFFPPTRGAPLLAEPSVPPPPLPRPAPPATAVAGGSVHGAVAKRKRRATRKQLAKRAPPDKTNRQSKRGTN